MPDSYPVLQPQPLALRLGVVHADRRVGVELGWQHLATHMAVYGGTGKGKSKYLELLLRQMIDQGAGVCVIDPHGDLVEDLLAFLIHRYDATRSPWLERVHYLDPGSAVSRFTFDPFDADASLLVDPSRYQDWLRAKVESVARAIIRKQGESDFEGRPRLERFLVNVLYTVGTRLPPQGRHLPLADALVLLDTQHDLHSRVFSRIADHLPPEIRSDFAKVHRSNPREQEQWIESTINRLRSFLSPTVKSIFSGEAGQTIDFRSILDRGEILLVNLRRTSTFTPDQANAIGGLIINEVLAAAETARRTERRRFLLVIDEASRFVGQDLIDALAQCRKWQLAICLAMQDLSSLQRNDIDMSAKVMSQCGTQVCFQQKHPDDLNVFAQLFGYPAIDMTPLIHEVDRPDGYEVIELRDTGSSDTWQQGEQSNAGSGFSTAQGETVHPTGSSSQKSDRSTSTSESRGTSQSQGGSTSTTFKQTTISKYRTEKQETGRLRRSVDDQFHEIKKSLRTLGQGQAMVAIDGEPPFLLEVATVEAAFATLDPQRRERILQAFQGHLAQHKPYCFDASQARSEFQRLEAFLTETLPPQLLSADEHGDRSTHIPFT